MIRQRTSILRASCPTTNYSTMLLLLTVSGLVKVLLRTSDAFSLLPTSTHRRPIPYHPSTGCQLWTQRRQQSHRLQSSIIFINLDDDDDDEEYYPEEEEDEDDQDVEEDPYRQIATSEFLDEPNPKQQNNGSSIVTSSPFLANTGSPTTNIDWGGALGKLRERVNDVESGKSQDPSHALFRLMSSKSPSQQIASFVSNASPQVVQAMSGAVGSLLGGLATPGSGVEMVVKASGEKIGSLCFQLQMTGYMFRNAEYVMALKKIMKLQKWSSIQDYKDKFQELDSDNSGYIDKEEIKELFDVVYDGKTPAFEVDAFMEFFDSNNDGKVSWEEFERGLGSAMAQQNQALSNLGLLQGASAEDEEDEDDDYDEDWLEPQISGTIEVELEDGKVVEVEAKEYVDNLKEEARALKAALRREKLGIVEAENRAADFSSASPLAGVPRNGSNGLSDDFGGIASYIASRQGDLDSLTKGISPEIVNTMKLLVEFVLDGGDSGKGGASAAAAAGVTDMEKAELQMELPSSALQQLALWQLVLGYRLREAEAKGDYLKLLE